MVVGQRQRTDDRTRLDALDHLNIRTPEEIVPSSQIYDDRRYPTVRHALAGLVSRDGQDVLLA
jgi:hypothetical protein